ncbi:MAG: polysaccharide biosynthesis protein, partial [Clostridium sp.]|nr:polysaccharide biosynthesis protein [Clostridium sp.]
ITRLRPGEKLYEELLMSEEGLTDTSNKKIYIGKPTFISMDKLEKKLNELQALLLEEDIEIVKEKMEEIVPTYSRVDYSKKSRKDLEVAISKDKE